jgi:hypothetical protein
MPIHTAPKRRFRQTQYDSCSRYSRRNPHRRDRHEMKIPIGQGRDSGPSTNIGDIVVIRVSKIEQIANNAIQ